MKTEVKQPMIKCPLCGFEFTKKGMVKTKCSSCPFRRGCKLICCPNCRYQFVDESKMASFIKKFHKEDKKGEKKS